ncbi:uncharacterized protein [Dysidea avara]|uniref:uncharacterized protein n=1 Tax=Dysidea avara TaxID=196820 RepID=UPI00332165B7
MMMMIELGFDPWSISSKGFEDMLTSQPVTSVYSQPPPPPPPVVDTMKTERHSQPLSSTFVDPQRQAAAAYVNYGPITNDQLHQLQYHGIPIHQQQHSPRSHPPTTSNNNTMENQLRALLPGINISIDSGAHAVPTSSQQHTLHLIISYSTSSTSTFTADNATHSVMTYPPSDTPPCSNQLQTCHCISV